MSTHANSSRYGTAASDRKQAEQASQYEGSSSVRDATFNFINSMVGAGIIGYAWAIANAGGLVSVVAIVVFAIMNKYAFDLVVALSVETEGARGSYENLGSAAFGKWGRHAVTTAKGLFTFGCLVIYLVICKDNFAPAMYHLLYKPDQAAGILGALLGNPKLTTALLSTSMVLPLCLLRSVQPLARLSVVKICIYFYLVCLVIYLFFQQSSTESFWDADSLRRNWLSIHPKGLVSSLGTYLFGFTAQHTVHMIFQSLKPELRNLNNWRTVSTVGTMAAAAISIAFGVFVYMTFWEASESNMFNMYQPSRAIDIARILLSLSCLMTFPLPFFSLRELLILSWSDPAMEGEGLVKRPLSTADLEDHGISEETFTLLDGTDSHSPWWLIQGEETQLILPCHLLFSCTIYFGALVLAIYARSLGDVLNFIGCATGTVMAFVLPALFSFKLRGYSHFSAFLLLVGGSVGLLGTITSFQTLVDG